MSVEYWASLVCDWQRKASGFRMSKNQWIWQLKCDLGLTGVVLGTQKHISCFLSAAKVGQQLMSYSANRCTLSSSVSVWPPTAIFMESFAFILAIDSSLHSNKIVRNCYEISFINLFSSLPFIDHFNYLQKNGWFKNWFLKFLF